jgi:hypothetical protein
MRYQVKPHNDGFIVVDTKLTEQGYSETSALVSFRPSKEEAEQVANQNEQRAQLEDAIAYAPRPAA